MKRIKKAKIKSIALCPRGANNFRVLYKAAPEGDTVAFDTLIAKADQEKGEILALVYAPEHPDLDGHLADAEAVREMCHTFAQEGHVVDIRHDGKPLDRQQAYVAESFIVQKTDERFAGLTDGEGRPVNAAGAWATLIKVQDPELRAKYRSGEWGGVSMYGDAIMAPEPPGDAKADAKPDAGDEPPGWLSKLLKAFTFGAIGAEAEMKKEDVEALVAKAVADALAAREALSKENPPAAPEAPAKEPEAKDEANPTLEALSAIQKSLEKLLGEAPIEKAAKEPSKQPPEDPAAHMETLSKEQVTQVQAGKRMAAYINGLRGRA